MLHFIRCTGVASCGRRTLGSNCRPHIGMNRTVRSVAYVAGFCMSVTASTSLLGQLFARLPDSLLGVVVGVLATVGIALALGVLEHALVWRHWLQPRSRQVPEALRSRSSLLGGNAPLPITMGVIAGAIIAVRLL